MCADVARADLAHAHSCQSLGVETISGETAAGEGVCNCVRCSSNVSNHSLTETVSSPISTVSLSFGSLGEDLGVESNVES